MRPSSNNTSGVRSFVALEVPSEIRNRVAAYCRDSGLDRLPGLRRVKTEQMHLTLHFLGDQPRERLHQLSDHLNRTLSGFPVFPLILQGLGVFPGQANPRVVWMGFESPSLLLNLHARVGKCLSDLAIQPDSKPFRAHLTLARIPAPLEPASARQLAEQLKASAGTLFAEFYAYHVIVFQSELRPGGPVYASLSSHALTDAPPSGMV